MPDALASERNEPTATTEPSEGNASAETAASAEGAQALRAPMPSELKAANELRVTVESSTGVIEVNEPATKTEDPITPMADTAALAAGAHSSSVPASTVLTLARRAREVDEPSTGVIEPNVPPMKTDAPETASALTVLSAAGAHADRSPVPVAENAARRDREVDDPPAGVTEVNDPPT